jgi:S-DNA-T family DNA segregation ATPase FtsK/SpoIIIE
MPTLTVVDPGQDRNPTNRKDFPALSVFDPVFIGVDEFGMPVTVSLMYRNMLVGGEPGAGKSVCC